jgi:hypothetical protein
MELDRAQTAYDAALRRVMSDLTGTTDLHPSVVVDLSDAEGLQYRFRPEGTAAVTALVLAGTTTWNRRR